MFLNNIYCLADSRVHRRQSVLCGESCLWQLSKKYCSPVHARISSATNIFLFWTTFSFFRCIWIRLFSRRFHSMVMKESELFCGKANNPRMNKAECGNVCLWWPLKPMQIYTVGPMLTEFGRNIPIDYGSCGLYLVGCSLEHDWIFEVHISVMRCLPVAPNGKKNILQEREKGGWGKEQASFTWNVEHLLPSTSC